jgi:hypothetical protein
METQTDRVLSDDQGTGSTTAAEAELQQNVPFVNPNAEPASDGSASVPQEVQGEPATSGQNLPPELQPDADGNPPKLTEKLLRSLRGKYFTVKHPVLTDCGHRLDMINEPRHRNCENCWFQWFNRHPQLIETADQFFREQGRKPMEGLRGAHFVKMFVRYMATVIHLMKEEGRINEKGELNESGNQEQPVTGSSDITANAQSEGREVASEVASVDASGETGSN